MVVFSVEPSLFKPRIYLVGVLGALETLQCIICHYLRMESQTESRMDEQIRPSIMIDINRYKAVEVFYLLNIPPWSTGYSMPRVMF